MLHCSKLTASVNWVETNLPWLTTTSDAGEPNNVTETRNHPVEPRRLGVRLQLRVLHPEPCLGPVGEHWMGDFNG